MAEHIRLRLAAAKVGVTMAFFGLLAGLAERARAATPQSPPANFLREVSSPTGADKVVIKKLDSALATLEHKLTTSFTTTHKLNQTFLKIKSANTSFLKIKSANTEFLKIKSANTSFLKIDDANSDFLKVGSTAANSSELGGLTPDAFFQGSGHVVTGAISSLAVSNTPTPLLSVPGGIAVSVANTVGSELQLQISNPTSQTLAAVLNSTDGTDSTVAEHDLAPGVSTSITFPVVGGTGQLHIQILPNALFSEVVTIIISTEESTTVNPSIVGQAFSGPS
jgi:hypothetical protein